jgi:hypothetical protein
MKNKFLQSSLITIIFSLAGMNLHAEDLRKIVSLTGSWKFTIGDDLAWAAPSCDDSKWDALNVPGRWEDQGYDDYNGYAWYRKKFRVSGIPANTAIYLMAGRIDDADEVYVNGKLMGRTGSFPPNFRTAYDRVRKYIVPAGFLNENGDNVIAIRVYDGIQDGGIMEGPVGLYTDADNDLLNLNLSRGWKFHTGDDKQWKAPEFNDSQWHAIAVPAEWENQGYANYDGYGWYRLKFNLPANLNRNDLYLSLGKVDDIDEVYVNGKYIGGVYDLRKDGEYRMKGWEYNARRIYKIPAGLLRTDGPNTIAVRVFDEQLRGGIYEGPIGLMTADNCKRYKNKHYTDQSFWDYVFDFFE